MAQYECTVRHLGKSPGWARHWQPVQHRTEFNSPCLKIRQLSHKKQGFLTDTK